MLAVTVYSISVGIHVIFAVSFLGMAGSFSVIGPAVREDITKAPFALGVIGKIQRIGVIPGVIGILLTGMYQLSNSSYTPSDDAWLLVSLIIFALMVGGLFITMPAVQTAKAEAEKFLAADGPPVPTPAFVAAIKKMSMIGPATGVGLMLITFLMEVKPF
ncbi:MAG: DUF2269 family protein [Thermoleophilaceae bacterium]|nr:DUF2269 family protein [Thermoleophilaceae bacterium]